MGHTKSKMLRNIATLKPIRSPGEKLKKTAQPYPNPVKKGKSPKETITNG